MSDDEEQATGARARAGHPAHLWRCSVAWAVCTTLTPWLAVLAFAGSPLLWGAILLGGGGSLLFGAHLGHRGAWLPSLLAVDAAALLLIVEAVCLTGPIDDIGVAISKGVPAGMGLAAFAVLPLAAGLLLGWAPSCLQDLRKRCSRPRRRPAPR
ncbi:hypothetical protein [Kitasatospora sp. NPDC004272]